MSWLILRTSGKNTLRLTKALGEQGFDVWTPIETRRIRIPRMNVKRDVTLPIMPSYVFASSRHLVDLLTMADAVKRCRRFKLMPLVGFSIMKANDGIAVVKDEHLTQLRRLEAKLTPRKRAERAFTGGVEVRVKVEGGSFAGMSGRVERSDQDHTLVIFDNRLSVKLPTSVLKENEVGNTTALNGVAALKAA